MSRKIFAVCLALFMLLQIPAVMDVFEDFGVQTTAEAATYKLKKPVISKLTNVSGGVKVQWGKVSGASNYRVMYKTSSSGSWKTAGTATSTSYTFKNVSSGKTYWFTVRCVSKSGKTATSGYDTTGEKIKYIAKPVISKLSNTSTGVKITWGKVPGAAKYRVLMKTSSGWKTVADTASTSYTYKTTNSGKKYTFSVRCVSSTGKSYTSYYDTTGKAVTFIAKPVIRQVTNAESGIKVTWGTVPGAYKYRLMVLRESDSTWKKVTDTAKTGATCKNLLSGEVCYFTVRCIDENGNYTSYYDTKGTKAVRSFPVITHQPADGYARAGDTAIVVLGAKGSGLKYAWYYRDGSGDFRRDSGATAAAYSTDMTADIEGREVYCIVTDAAGGSVKSETAVLRLLPSDYTWQDTADGIRIARYTGSDTKVTVPAEIGGVPVTGIGDNAFGDCASVTSIDLPDGIKSIGAYAFSECAALTGIDLPDSVRSIGLHAFSGCDSLTSVKIPSGVTKIGQQAFYCCTALTSVDLPKKITAIPEGLFFGCTALTGIDLPDGITAIDSMAFSGCTALTELDVPDSVTSLGLQAIPLHTLIVCGEDSYAYQWCLSHGRRFDLR